MSQILQVQKRFDHPLFLSSLHETIKIQHKFYTRVFDLHIYQAFKPKEVNEKVLVNVILKANDPFPFKGLINITTNFPFKVTTRDFTLTHEKDSDRWNNYQYLFKIQ